MARFTNGTTDRLRTVANVPALDAPTKLCVAIRVRPTDLTTGNRHIITKRGASDAANCWGLQTTGGGAPGNAGLLFLTSNAGVAYGLTDAVTLTADVSTHVCIVFDGALSGDSNRLKMYTDGVQRTLTFAGTQPAQIGSNTEPITLGFSNDAGDTHWLGSLAEAAVWIGETLTDGEISALAAGRVSPNRVRRSALQAYWPLGYGSPEYGSPEPDYSGYGNNLILTGTTIVDHPPAALPFGFDELIAVSVPVAVIDPALITPSVCSAAFTRTVARAKFDVRVHGWTFQQFGTPEPYATDAQIWPAIMQPIANSFRVPGGSFPRVRNWQSGGERAEAGGGGGAPRGGLALTGAGA